MVFCPTVDPNYHTYSMVVMVFCPSVVTRPHQNNVPSSHLQLITVQRCVCWGGLITVKIGGRAPLAARAVELRWRDDNSPSLDDG